MMRFCAAAFLAIPLLGTPPARADDAEVGAVLDKAIKALGGEEALKKAAGFSYKSKGVLILGGNEIEFAGNSTVAGIDRYRAEFEGDIEGNPTKIAVVLDGDKAWRKFNDNLMELDGDDLANEKRMVYLQAVAATVLPLKGKGFKVESAGEEKVGDKTATALKVTGPDGKDFKLWLDKESGLPVKQVAQVRGIMGEDSEQEVLYKDYKDFGGIKRATKVETKRDGERFLTADLSDVKPLEKVEPDTFAEPK